jgi:thioredoxin 1
MATFQEIVNSDKPVLVDFAAEWCGPCKMMKPILKDLKNQMGDDITIITVDVDRNQAAAAQYNIRSVPTLMIFKKGESLWRQSGVLQAGQLQSILKQYM